MSVKNEYMKVEAEILSNRSRQPNIGDAAKLMKIIKCNDISRLFDILENLKSNWMDRVIEHNEE